MSSLTPSVVTHRDPKGLKLISKIESVYDKARLDDERAQRLNESALFTVHLADIIQRFSRKDPDYSLAQSILSADFITPEEVTKACSGIVYTAEQIMALAESLPPLDVLKWCKEKDYAVMPSPPKAMSLLDVREIQSVHFYVETDGWYAKDKEKFAREDKTSFGWLLIKKTPVGTIRTSQTWKEQTNPLSRVEMVPNVAEMSWFIMTYFGVRGVRLFEDVYVWTSSLDSDGYRINIGGFDAKGLDVGSYWDDIRRSIYIGWSAARKQ